MIPYSRSNNGSLTVFFDGKSHVFAPDCKYYTKIRDAIAKGNLKTLRALAKPAKTITLFSGKKVRVKGGVVYYKSNPLHNTMTNRILNLIASGFPFKPMLRCLEKTMENPDPKAITELCEFLENRMLPIAEDGDIIAFKKVKDDFTDYYTGTINYKIGSTVEVERKTVDDNRDNCSSNGLHVGALQYARDDYNPGQGKILVVKVNPKDFVSVPKDYSCQKARVCKMKVLSEYDGTEVGNDYYQENRAAIASESKTYV